MQEKTYEETAKETGQLHEVLDEFHRHATAAPQTKQTELESKAILKIFRIFGIERVNTVPRDDDSFPF